MDERAVFERFHEALDDIEPRAGTYERFRATFTNPPAAAKRRPVFRMRFSKMGFRVAAALAAAAIVIAVVAAIAATHYRPTANLSASQDRNLKAYQALVLSDYNAFVNATSNHCNTIDDEGCAAAIAHLIPAMQKWVNDLAAFHTPAQFAVLDGRLRAHLTEVETELANWAVDAQRHHDVAGFSLAMNAALYERAWVDPATFTLDGSYVQGVASYRDAVRIANRSLLSCVNTTPGPDALGCGHLSAAESCLGAAAQACADDIQSAETQLQNFFIALAQNPAPSALSAKDRQFETALANADDALLAMVGAQLSGDALKVSNEQLAYEGAINTAEVASEGLGT